MFVAATSCPVRRRALNTDAFQMTGSCSMVAASASRLDRAALKGTSWAAGSCSRATSARTAQVSVVSCRVVSRRVCVAPSGAANNPPTFSFFLARLCQTRRTTGTSTPVPNPTRCRTTCTSEMKRRKRRRRQRLRPRIRTPGKSW